MTELSLILLHNAEDLSENNFMILKKFDRILVNESLSDARRSKILGTMLSLSRILQKNWDETSKEDIKELVYNFNKKFSKEGQETNTTADHKKILVSQQNVYGILQFLVKKSQKDQQKMKSREMFLSRF